MCLKRYPKIVISCQKRTQFLRDICPSYKNVTVQYYELPPKAGTRLLGYLLEFLQKNSTSSNDNECILLMTSLNMEIISLCTELLLQPSGDDNPSQASAPTAML
jgi:hypothetical protein